MIELSAKMTGAEIARQLGVSRQRIHQVLKRWKHLRPDRPRNTDACRATLLVAAPRETKNQVVTFRLTPLQAKRANELLERWGLTRQASNGAACRAVLLCALDWSFAIDCERLAPKASNGLKSNPDVNETDAESRE